jgi:hypothetical protein
MTAPTFHVPEEPVLDVDDIQGNVLPGFMKPHMRLISLVFGDIAQARTFLRGLDVTSLRDVLGSRNRVREVRGLQPSGDKVGAVPDDLDDLWLNLAVSYTGLMKLAGRSERRRSEVEAFTDNAFRLGLCARSVTPSGDRDASRYEKLLGSPIGFLEQSSELYGSGQEDESLRLATLLRVIFHDTNSSTTLLSHLQLKRTQMLSSSSGHGNGQRRVLMCRRSSSDISARKCSRAPSTPSSRQAYALVRDGSPRLSLPTAARSSRIRSTLPR